MRITVVLKLRPKKDKLFRRRTETINLKNQVIIGDTALEAMRCPQVFFREIKKRYVVPIIIRIDFVQIINFISKTNYLT